MGRSLPPTTRDPSEISRRRELVDLRRRQPHSPLTFPFHDENDLFEQVRLGERNEATRTFALIARQLLALPVTLQRQIAWELVIVVTRAAAFGGAALDELAMLKEQVWAACERSGGQELLGSIGKLIESLCVAVRSARGNQDSELIGWALDYVDKRCGEKLTEAAVAGQLLLAPASFSRLFKRETGYTFNDYLNRLRLRRAMKDLGDPALTLADIAARNGYSTVQYFSSVFRRYVGMSPGQCRTLLTQGEWIADRFSPLIGAAAQNAGPPLTSRI